MSILKYIFYIHFIIIAYISLVCALSIAKNSIISALGSMMLSINHPNYLNYDNFSFNYDNLNSGSVTSILKIDNMRSLASDFVNGNVLEIAVGTGIQTNYYNWNNIKSYTAFDSSEGMLKQTIERLKDLSVDKKNTLFVADATNIPLPDSQVSDNIVLNISLSNI